MQFVLGEILGLLARARRRKELENEENNEFTKSSENNNEEIEDEQNLSLIAELNIELLIAETANDDIFSNENEQEKKFLEATKSTLENLISMTENININNIQGLSFNHDIIIYKYNDMEEKIKNVIEKIKLDYQEQLEENFNQYLNDEDSFIGPQRNPTIPTSDPTLLNTSQQQILNTAKEYFQDKKNATHGPCQTPPPFKMLVHGGPGNIIKN